MKTQARPVYVKRQERILAHFITCFIALIIYRYLEKKLDNQYSIDQILSTFRIISGNPRQFNYRDESAGLCISAH